MERREGIDRPNEEAMAAFSKRAADGPVFMLNLLEFEPEGGAERYAEYGEAVAPLFARAGGKPIFAGRLSESLIGEGSWDLMPWMRSTRPSCRAASRPAGGVPRRGSPRRPPTRSKTQHCPRPG
jgi:hypothetical protein